MQSSKKCQFIGCDRRHESKGLCSGHAQQRRKGVQLTSLKARKQQGYLKDHNNYYLIDLEETKISYPETWRKILDGSLTNRSNRRLVAKCLYCSTTRDVDICDFTRGKSQCSSCKIMYMSKKNSPGLLIDDPIYLEIDKETTSSLYSEKQIQWSSISKSSAMRIAWLCKQCQHSWIVSPNNRSRGEGCPECAKTYGKLEKRFLTAINEIAELQVIAHGSKLPLRYTSGWLGVEVDLIAINILTGRSIYIEIDGKHWHEFEEVQARDIYKTNQLLKSLPSVGIVRIRVDGLDLLPIENKRLLQVNYNYCSNKDKGIREVVSQIQDFINGPTLSNPIVWCESKKLEEGGNFV